jgi:ParB/RepB/Spo0J family partition protein
MKAHKIEKSELKHVPSNTGVDTYDNQPREEWDITKIEPHPRQVELVGEYSDDEIIELASDIEAHGLKHALEVHPRGYLIAGHRRKAALERLGRTTVPVIVRHDLAELGDAAVEMHLIRDNLMRTDHHPLTIARFYTRLKELESGRRGLTDSEVGALRDQLAKRFGKSGRTLDRYAAVLRTPAQIQEAIRRGQLTMTVGESIAALPKNIQAAIAGAIAGGTPPKTAAKRYLGRPQHYHRFVENGVAGLARALSRFQDDLEDRIEDIEPGDATLSEHLPVFRDAIDFLGELIEQLARTSEEEPEDESDPLAALGPDSWPEVPVRYC